MSNAVKEKVTEGVCASCQSPAVVEFVPRRPPTLELELSELVDEGDVYMGPHFVVNTEIPCEGYGTTPQALLSN